jgi:hypothetical protein
MRTLKAVPVVLLAVVAACETTPTGPGDDLRPAFQVAIPATVRTNEIWVCKEGPAGTYNFTSVLANPAVDEITFSADAPGGAFSLQPDECKLIGTGHGRLIVTETEAAGTDFVRADNYRTSALSPGQSGPLSFVTSILTNPAQTAAFGIERGALTVFVNEPEPPPPPGGEGCTPGYWKQTQHFDSWEGYTPGQLFSSVFEDAFPGMTLLQVLSQGGGGTGAKALGRHVVAALLNSASSGVNYDMTTQEVIDAFNAVFPVTETEYNALKDELEDLNQQGCPLN